MYRAYRIFTWEYNIYFNIAVQCCRIANHRQRSWCSRGGVFPLDFGNKGVGGDQMSTWEKQWPRISTRAYVCVCVCVSCLKGDIDGQGRRRSRRKNTTATRRHRGEKHPFTYYIYYKSLLISRSLKEINFCCTYILDGGGGRDGQWRDGWQMSFHCTNYIGNSHTRSRQMCATLGQQNIFIFFPRTKIYCCFYCNSHAYILILNICRSVCINPMYTTKG